MLTTEFAVFIISHERANNLSTLKVLQNGGYNGDWFIVVDDEDKQLADYQKLYKQHLIIFDKKEIAKTTDTMDNFKIMTSAVYARNFVIEEAKRRGYKYYAMFDDDCENFAFRYVKDNQLKSMVVSDVNKIFEAVVQFLDLSQIGALSFKQAGGMFGGLNGEFQKGLGTEPSQTYFLKTSFDYKFSATRSEDSIFNQMNWTNGNPTFSIYSLNNYSPERGTNSGGLNEDYAAANDYIVNFYNIILCPSAYRLKIRNDKITLTRQNNLKRPKILSGRWKK